jgi:hypothetical protein
MAQDVADEGQMIVRQMVHRTCHCLRRLRHFG